MDCETAGERVGSEGGREGRRRTRWAVRRVVGEGRERRKSQCQTCVQVKRRSGLRRRRARVSSRGRNEGKGRAAATEPASQSGSGPDVPVPGGVRGPAHQARYRPDPPPLARELMSLPRVSECPPAPCPVEDPGGTCTTKDLGSIEVPCRLNSRRGSLSFQLQRTQAPETKTLRRPPPH